MRAARRATSPPTVTSVVPARASSRIPPGRCSTAPRVPAESSEPVAAAASTEPREAADPIDRIDPAQPREPIDSTEPVEHTDSTDPVEQTESTEPLDAIDSRDRVEARQSVAITTPSCHPGAGPMPVAQRGRRPDMSVPERPAVRVPERDPASLQRVNAVLGRILASPLARVLPLPLVRLRYTGRRTGRTISTPVGMHKVDDKTVIFTRSGWRANFRGGGAVEIVRRGRVLRGSATTIEDPERAADLMLAVLAAGRSPRQLGLEVDKGHQPTRAELVATGTSFVQLDVQSG